jgi:hypothetical protein
MIASKRNQKALVTLFLQNGADIRHSNRLNLNAIDYAVIHGNYEIAFVLKNQLSETEMGIKPLEEYIHFNKIMGVPYFDIPLFYKNLTQSVKPSQETEPHFIENSFTAVEAFESQGKI